MDLERSSQPGIPTEPSPPTIVAGAVAGQLLADQVLDDRYVIRKRIGAGGMGCVYRADDRRMEEEIALKVLLPERIGPRNMLRRLRREVRLARKVTHPNVCRVFDLGNEGELWFLTMELIEGRTLRSVLAERRVEPAEAFGILEHIVAGLAAAHEQKVIHLDLKPENVILCRDGRAVIVDFGLARSAIVQMSSANNMAGTLAYMSPEHLQGDPLDNRSDLFSLGVLAYELLTGRSPFARRSLPEVGDTLLEHAPASIEVPGLPANVVRAVEQVLSRSVAKRPEDRFASAADFGAALAAARQGIAPESLDSSETADRRTPMPVSTVLSVPRKPGRWRGALAALALSVAAAAGLFVWRSENAAPPPVEEVQPPVPYVPSIPDTTSRPGIIVKAFENLSGDPSQNDLAQAAGEKVRAGLRTMRQVELLDDVTKMPGAVWVVTGNVQRVGDELRLFAQVRAMNGSSAGEPVQIDKDPKQSVELLEGLGQGVLDETRLLWQLYDRQRWAERGTSVDEARKALLQYYELIGPGALPSHADAGKPLLDQALKADPRYVPALVERAYLQVMGFAARDEAEKYASPLADLDSALAISPGDPRTLVMRCRLIQVALNKADRPTDADFDAAEAVCNTAMRADPYSAYVPFVLARLHDLRCQDDKAIQALERALELDHSLSGRILTHIVMLALQNDQLPPADRMSKQLAEFQREETRRGQRSLSRRAGVSPTFLGHVLRAAVLMRLKRFDEAQLELERELENVTGRMGNPWSEPAAIRGLLRIARHQGRPADPDLERRLAALEQARFTETVGDPEAAYTIASNYEWTDPEAALAWVKKLPPPPSFHRAFEHAWSHHTAGDDAGARRILATQRPVERWERVCAAWIESRLD